MSLSIENKDAILRNAAAAEQADPLDKDSGKYAKLYRFLDNNEYAVIWFEEASQKPAAEFDTISELMISFAQRPSSSTPMAVCRRGSHPRRLGTQTLVPHPATVLVRQMRDLPFAGQRVIVTGSLFQLEAVLGTR